MTRRSRSLVLLLGLGACGSRAPALPLSDHSERLPPNNASTTDVQLADFDRDGDLDILWLSQDWPATGPVALPGGVDLSVNDGAGHFQRAELGIAFDSPQFALPVDVDGDGDLDLVISRAARREPQVALFLNDGQARFTPAELPAIHGDVDGVTFARVVATDVNLDGRPDLVVPIFGGVDAETGEVTHERPSILLVNQGSGTFMRDTEERLPAFPRGQSFTNSIAAGDINGDGAPDLFFGQAERPPRLLVNDGTGHFTDETRDDGAGTPRLAPDPLRLYHSAMADLDRDGDLDIVGIRDVSITGGAPSAGENVKLVNDSGGHFTAAPLTAASTPRDSRGLAIGDLDGDGAVDVVIGNASATLSHDGQAVEVALGTAGGELGPPAALGPWAVGVFAVALGDLDGDGRPDVVGGAAEPDDSGSLHNLLLLTGGGT